MDKKPASSYQVAGTHYQQKGGEQHWDRIYRLYGRGYFVGCATKYIERYHLKNGKQDLEKAIHFLEKLIELEYPEQAVGVKFEGNPDVKYPEDYQKKLSEKMEKMRIDAMRGLSNDFTTRAIPNEKVSAITNVMRDLVDTCDPLPNGYVNQDSYVRPNKW